MGSTYSHRDHSLTLGNHTLKSVNLFSFDKPNSIYLPLVTWLVSAFNENADIDDASYWPNALFITGVAASMAVNTLVTGMIVFRFLKVAGVVKPTSVERTLGSAGGNKFRHIMFIIIESAMALFAIQLVRVVLLFMPVQVAQEPFFIGAENIVIVINQMLNVIIIRFIQFYFFRFADNIYLAIRASHQR